MEETREYQSSKGRFDLSGYTDISLAIMVLGIIMLAIVAALSVLIWKDPAALKEGAGVVRDGIIAIAGLAGGQALRRKG